MYCCHAKLVLIYFESLLIYFQIYFTLGAVLMLVIPAIIITICYTIIVVVVWKNSAFTPSDTGKWFFSCFFCRFLNVSRLACKPRDVQLISSSGSRIDSSEKRTRIQNSPFYLSFRNMTSRIFKVFFQIVKTVINKINMIYGFHVGWRVVHVFKEEKPVESILVISITSQVDWQFTW